MLFTLLLIFTTVCLDNQGFGQQCDVCPNGWTRYEASCYLVGYEQSVSFIEAEHYCRQHDGHLVHVETSDENRFIVDILHKTQAGHCWLGLTDMDIEGTWEWYDTNSRPGYSHWNPGEPNGGNGEDCAVYATHTAYLWNDYPCTAKLHPVCEMTPGNAAIIG